MVILGGALFVLAAIGYACIFLAYPIVAIMSARQGRLRRGQVVLSSTSLSLLLMPAGAYLVYVFGQSLSTGGEAVGFTSSLVITAPIAFALLYTYIYLVMQRALGETAGSSASAGSPSR